MSGTSSTMSKVAKPVVTARKTANPANDTSNKENYAMAHRRETRDRRLTEKVAQQIRDEEVAAAKKASLAARRVARAKKVQYKLDKASGITQDVDNSDLEERHDTVFTSRTVPSKPAGVSGRSQAVVATATPAIKRHGKVPPPPSGRYEETNLESDGLSTDDNDDDDEPRGRPMRRRTGGGRHVSSSLSASSGDSPAAFDNSPPPSPLPLGSLSPTTASNKRNRKEDSDEDEDTLVFVKAQKITDNTGRPKASDYDDVGKEVILAAANIYRCLISTIDGFPDSAMEIKFVKMAWNRANEDAQIIPMELTPSIGKIIKQRGSQLRGEAKNKITALVETMYGFGSGHRTKTIKANRKLAEELKFEKGYIYKVLTEDSRKGIYQHPIIQMGVSKLWFNNKRDEGVIYSDMFDPMPVPAIALILTTIECSIDEWTTGTKTDVTYYADDYREIYKKHIASLEMFGEETRQHKLLERLQKRLHNYGRLDAGAPPVAFSDIPAIPISAFKAALKEYEEDPATDDDGEMEL